MKMLRVISGLLFLTQVSALIPHDEAKAHKQLMLVDRRAALPVAVGNFVCGDRNSGLGFIMFTAQATNVRFAADQANWAGHAAKNFMCVRYLPQTSKWQYDANWGNALTKVTWKDFTLQAQDFAVASVDFGKQAVTSMMGLNTMNNGLRVGYASGDLTFSMTGVGGSQLSTWAEAAKTPPKVVVVTGVITCGKPDSSTGLGFVLYSAKKVNERFSSDQATWTGHVGKSFMCVRWVGSKWQYDANWGNWAKREVWKDFTPVATDQAVAAVHFGTSKVETLAGYKGTANGLNMGYSAGDLSFGVISLNAEVGWLTISGAFLTNWQTGTGGSTPVSVGGPAPAPAPPPTPPTPAPVPVAPKAGPRIPLASGNLFCGDSVSGEGFIMFSVAAVNVRFSGDKADWTQHTAMNFVCVRFKGGWQYDANWGDVNGGVLWKPFVPAPNDVGVHAADFLTGDFESTRSLNSVSNGLKIGFSDSDIDVETRGEGIRNRLSIRVSWISFWTAPATQALQLKATTGSLACGAHGSGMGFVMYTHQPVSLRWSKDTNNFVKHAAKNFVCVRFMASKWQYDANWGNWARKPVWKDFVPVASDVAVVKIEHESRRLKDYVGYLHTLHGLRLGYSKGDLTFTSSVADDVEWVTVDGSSLEEWMPADSEDLMTSLGMQEDVPMTQTRPSWIMCSGLGLACVVGLLIAVKGWGDKVY